MRWPCYVSLIFYIEARGGFQVGYVMSFRLVMDLLCLCLWLCYAFQVDYVISWVMLCLSGWFGVTHFLQWGTRWFSGWSGSCCLFPPNMR